MIFGPLIEPFDSGLPPWNPADADGANNVLKHFISFLNRLHLAYDAFLPPGSENLETLLWQYYALRIATLKQGGLHVHKLMVNLNIF